ncbi:MAG: UDP-N-acetylmuramate:L-alanyl-gamma-D-glutamyl-meso-diaminopimelate ligase, partial [Verrucomicrobiae bacterium]|nr:UDP-N-acetylmuramate:L-alanyl-gamma-D-glutamyl-meso-diaminopimelate ligase [Verrucomicrobiae bacterium]
FLEQNQITVLSPYRPENLHPAPDVIVIGNAISRGNPELEAALERKLRYFSLPETLKEFCLRGKHNLVVTGTHGKTTTSSMLAWVFEATGRNPGYMIGGIPRNLQAGARLGGQKYFIIEGDEYDTAFFDKRSKFLNYLPELLIINNIEFDHADIFSSLQEIQRSFRQLVNIVPRNGMILVNADDPNSLDVVRKAFAPVLEVGFSPNAGMRIADVHFAGSETRFKLLDHAFTLPMLGEHNVRNAAMAIAAAHFYQIPIPEIADAIGRFEGVKRRQEVRGEVAGVTIIDDFGHHPTAIKETLEALRHRYRDQRIWAIFEPRSNTTRRAVFQKELAECFEEADIVCMSQIARPDQLPVNDRLNPEKVIATIQSRGKSAYYLPGVEEIVQRVKSDAKSKDVVVVFSNGGFGGIHEKLLSALSAGRPPLPTAARV